MSKFYVYRQNNSGGGWDFVDGRISVNVIIEANSTTEADDRAERIGIYFDGCSSGRDCSCCGDRWSCASTYNEYDVPSVYGEPVAAGDEFPAPDQSSFMHKWMEEGRPEGYIHYLNGDVLPFWATTAARRDLDGQYGWGVNFGRNWDTPSVFLCGSAGYDEEGNRKAAGAEDPNTYSWVKPDAPTVNVRREHGYIEAWFPTEQEANDFAAALVNVKRSVDAAIAFTLNNEKSMVSDPLLRDAIEAWAP